MSVLENVKGLQSMIEQGKSLEALDKYYADNCTITEVPTNEVRQGKEAQRAAIHQWFSQVKEFHGSGCESINANEEDQTSSTEVWMDVTMANGHRMKMQEVCTQKWQDGKIIDEKFYYNAPPQS